MKRLFLTLCLFFLGTHANGQPALTVHAWPARVIQYQENSAGQFEHIIVDNPTGAAVQIAHAGGWNGQTGFSSDSGTCTIPASTSNYDCGVETLPGVWVPAIQDTSGNWYSACTVASFGCAPQNRYVTCVAHVVMIVGQSNELGLEATPSGNEGAPTNPCPEMVTSYIDANGYPQPNTTFTAATGALITAGNLLYAKTGVPIVFAVAAVGGAPYTLAEAQALCNHVPQIGGCYGVQNGAPLVADGWTNTTSPPGTGGGYLWNVFTTFSALFNNTFAAIIIGSGESSVLDTPANIQAALTTWLNNMLAVDTMKPAVVLRRVAAIHAWDQYATFQAPPITTTFTCSNAVPAGAGAGLTYGCWSNTWMAQNSFVAATPGVMLGAITDDLLIPSPGEHFTGPQYDVIGYRLAASLAKML